MLLSASSAGWALGRGRTALAAALTATVVLGTGLVATAGSAIAESTAKPEARKGIFNPKTFTLGNGLQVVVLVNRRAPVALHMVWYKAGAADEPPGTSGIAHFLEHLMFKGTESLGPGEFSKIVASNGGRENAFTSWDYTAYYQFVAKDRLPTVMKIEADRMANLVIPEEEIRRERSVILEERRSRTENKPSSILWEQMRAALFLNHPYGRPIIGWMHEMEKLSLKDAMSFYKRYYAPNNAVLIVAGDVSADEVKAMAEKHYGPIKPAATGERTRPQEPPQRAERRVTYSDARVRQPTLTRMYMAPSFNRGETKHAHALQVLDQLLGSSATSRLYQALVVEKKLATSVGAGYGPNDLDLSTFYVYGTPRPGVSLDQLEAAIDTELKRMLEEGVTEAEVAAAKQRLKDAAVFARDNLRSGAMVIGTALTTGRTVDDVESWPERIEAVTVEQVDAAARYVFRPGRSVTGRLLPEPAAAEPAKALAPKQAVPGKAGPKPTGRTQ